MTRRVVSFPPLVGITGDLISPKPGAPFSEETVFLPYRYCRAIEDAGGVPLLLPNVTSMRVIRHVVDRLDGLLISGGNFDIDPRHYGERRLRCLREIKKQRTDFELNITTLALERDLPVLGICGGAQAINVALGGSLYQDISTQVPNAGEHEQSNRKHAGGHRVRVFPGTQLARIIRRRILEANTTHHQAIKKPGHGLVVNATAPDGIIEGIESPRHSFALGVQWHPEVLAPRNPQHRRLFSSFIAACQRLGRGNLKS